MNLREGFNKRSVEKLTWGIERMGEFERERVKEP